MFELLWLVLCPFKPKVVLDPIEEDWGYFVDFE